MYKAWLVNVMEAFLAFLVVDAVVYKVQMCSHPANDYIEN